MRYLILSFVFILSACGSSLPSGTYSTTCYESGSSLPRLAYKSKTIVIDDSSAADSKVTGDASGTLVKTERYFADSACTEQTYEDTYSFSFSASIVSEDSETRLMNVDLTRKSITYTPKSTLAASLDNQVSFCGKTDWTSGVSVEVTTLTCGDDVIPSPGSVFYNLFQVTEGSSVSLSEGDVSSGQPDGSTAEARPTKAETIVYTKQD